MLAARYRAPLLIEGEPGQLVVENRVRFANIKPLEATIKEKTKVVRERRRKTLTANKETAHGHGLSPIQVQTSDRQHCSTVFFPTPATNGAVGGNEAWSETVRGDGSPRRPLSGRSRARRHSPQQDDREGTEEEEDGVFFIQAACCLHQMMLPCGGQWRQVHKQAPFLLSFFATFTLHLAGSACRNQIFVACTSQCSVKEDLCQGIETFSHGHGF
jgi:hypothetical protein